MVDSAIGLLGTHVQSRVVEENKDETGRVQTPPLNMAAQHVSVTSQMNRIVTVTHVQVR